MDDVAAWAMTLGLMGIPFVGMLVVTFVLEQKIIQKISQFIEGRIK